jgi:hypothetical protein
MDVNIISEGIKPDILELIHQGEFGELILKIDKKKKGFFDFFKTSIEKTHFAYEILPSCLNKTIKPKEYRRISKLNFKTEFLNEIIELHRILLILQDFAKAPEVEKLVSLTLLECIKDGAAHIGKKTNSYPHNSINGKIWMDGAGLRKLTDELSEYFESKEDDQNTLETVFLRAKLTNTIMSHYPNLVGPDMIAVALQLEKMGDLDKAKQFLNPVVLDFTSLVIEVEEGLEENGIVDEDFPITESLIQALEGLKRLGEDINEETLNRSKELLEKLNKATNTM